MCLYLPLLSHSQIRAVVASVKELKSLQSIRSKCPSLELIIVMDDTTWDQALLADQSKLPKELYSYRMSELERIGAAALDKFPAGVSHSKVDDIHTICYTSGTTGNVRCQNTIEPRRKSHRRCARTHLLSVFSFSVCVPPAQGCDFVSRQHCRWSDRNRRACDSRGAQ